MIGISARNSALWTGRCQSSVLSMFNESMPTQATPAATRLCAERSVRCGCDAGAVDLFRRLAGEVSPDGRHRQTRIRHHPIGDPMAEVDQMGHLHRVGEGDDHRPNDVSGTSPTSKIDRTPTTRLT